MHLPIRDLLTERSLGSSGKRRALLFAISLFVHACLATAFLLAPMLSASEDALPQYVAVQIIPAQMLGISTPIPESPPPTPREESPVESESLPGPVVQPEPDRPAPSVRPSTTPPKPKRVTPKRIETRTVDRPQRQGSPSGSALGTSNFGAAVAGFDNPEFTYDYYVDRMLDRIRQHWVRPPLGGSIEATVRFRILKGGKVVDVRILASSGFNSFDLAALRAIQLASPLPPLPQSFKHNSLGVNLVVR